MVGHGDGYAIQYYTTKIVQSAGYQKEQRLSISSSRPSYRPKMKLSGKIPEKKILMQLYDNRDILKKVK